MRYELSDTPNGRSLSLRDNLTFEDRAAFEALIPQALAGGKALVVVLERLDYMDSAGLGMLLTLRDKAEQAGVPVLLSKPRGEVRELLALACFDTLFPIEG
jgi:anti-sigma B factor antagonist